MCRWHKVEKNKFKLKNQELPMLWLKKINRIRLQLEYIYNSHILLPEQETMSTKQGRPKQWGIIKHEFYTSSFESEACMAA